MEKVFIKKNAQVIGRAKQVAEYVIPDLQKFVDEAKAAGVEIDFRRWESIAASPNEYLRTNYLERVREEDTLSPSGLRVTTREQVAERTLSLEGSRYNSFIEASENLTRSIARQSFQTDYPFTNLLSVEDGRAVLDSDAVMDLIESNTEYATHPKDIKLWEEMNKTIQQVNSFNRLLRDEYRLPITIEGGYPITTVGEKNFGKWFKTELNQSENLVPDPQIFLTICKSIQK